MPRKLNILVTVTCAFAAASAGQARPADPIAAQAEPSTEAPSTTTTQSTTTQTQAPATPPPAAAETPAPATTQTTTTTETEQSTTAPAASGETPAAAGLVTKATAADIKAGASVYDESGALVGKVDSVAADSAVVNTGTIRAQIELSAFAKNDKGLVISATKAELDAKAKAAKPKD